MREIKTPAAKPEEEQKTKASSAPEEPALPDEDIAELEGSAVESDVSAPADEVAESSRSISPTTTRTPGAHLSLEERNALKEPVTGFLLHLEQLDLAVLTAENVWVVKPDVFDNWARYLREYEEAQSAKLQAGAALREQTPRGGRIETARTPIRPADIPDQGVQEKLELEKTRAAIRNEYGVGVKYRRVFVGEETYALSAPTVTEGPRTQQRKGLSLAIRDAQRLDQSIRQKLAAQQQKRLQKSLQAKRKVSRRRNSGS